MTERLPRLHPPFADPHRQALRAALVGGRRGTGPRAFYLTAADGSLIGPFGLMLQVPHLGEPLQELGAAVRFATSLDDRAREVAILTVSAVTRSDFAQYAHERVGAMAGLDDDEYRTAVGVLGERCLLELVVLVGYYAMLAQMMSVFGVGAPDVAAARGTA